MNTSSTIPTDDDQGQSDPSIVSTQPSVRDDIGAALFRMNGDEPPPSPAALPSDEDTTGNATREGVNPAAPETPSRREKASARTDEEIDAEVERRLQARLAAPPPTPETPSEPDEHETWITTERGTDEEWLELSSRNDRGLLGYDDLRRWNRMNAIRDGEKVFSSVFEKRAQQQFESQKQGLFQSLAQQALEVAALPHVDADYIHSHPGYGDICKHFYEAGKKANATELERTKGELKEARARNAGSAPTPLYGGRSATVGIEDTPDPRQADPDTLLTHGLRKARLPAGARR